MSMQEDENNGDARSGMWEEKNKKLHKLTLAHKNSIKMRML